MYKRQPDLPVMIAGTSAIVQIEIPSRSRHVQNAVHINIGMAFRFRIFDLVAEGCGKGGAPVSYTHLAVYKRQTLTRLEMSYPVASSPAAESA